MPCARSLPVRLARLSARPVEVQYVVDDLEAHAEAVPQPPQDAAQRRVGQPLSTAPTWKASAKSAAVLPAIRRR